MIRMTEQMHTQFVKGWKSISAKLTFMLAFTVMGSDVFTNNRIFNKISRALRTIESSIVISMCFDMVF